MGKVFKEVFIILLLLVVIILTISMVFYDFFHNTQELPVAREYVADGNVKSTLQEIEASSEDEKEGESLLKSYEIVRADLKNYASKKSYEKGKVNPFAAYENNSEVINTNTTNTSSGNNSGSSSSATSTSGTSTSSSSSQGTFFEAPNSK